MADNCQYYGKLIVSIWCIIFVGAKVMIVTVLSYIFCHEFVDSLLSVSGECYVTLFTLLCLYIAILIYLHFYCCFMGFTLIFTLPRQATLSQ